MQCGAAVVFGGFFSVCSSGIVVKAGWFASLSGDKAGGNDGPVFCAEGMAWGLENRWGMEVFLTSADSIACGSVFAREKRGA